MFRKIFIAAAMLITALCCVSAIYADEISEGSVTVNCDIPEMKWEIYRVADANPDSTLTPDEFFSEYNIPDFFDFEKEVQTLAYTFENYILKEECPPAAEGVSDGQGRTVFYGLSEGWYTVIPSQVVSENTVYTSSPVMVCITSYSAYSGVWGMNADVSPKSVSREKTSDNLKDIYIKYYPDDYNNDSTPVEVIVYADDREFSHIWLNPDDDWTYIIPGMPDDGTTWTVIIKGSPDDVYPVYQKDTATDFNRPIDSITIWPMRDLNSTPSEEPHVSEGISDNPDRTGGNEGTETTGGSISSDGDSSLPQTGQLWWPVPLLASCGMLFIVAGCIMKSGGRGRR